MTMEYFTPIAIFLMVWSPLFIPVGVTIVHTVRTPGVRECLSWISPLSGGANGWNLLSN